MNEHHYRFEVQCILASCGQLSVQRLERLREHAASCDMCRKHLLELAELNVRLWTAMPRQHKSATTTNMTERFVTRAIREGMPLSDKSVDLSARVAFALPAIILLAVIGVAVIGYGGGKGTHETATNSATHVFTGQRSAPSGGLQLANEPARSRNRTTHGTRVRGQLSGFGRLPQRRVPVNHLGQGASLWKNGSRLWLATSRDVAGKSKFPLHSGMAPALAAWLARQSSPRLWASFDYETYGDARDPLLSRSGDQPYAAGEYNKNYQQPVFCFDPRIALVASSKSWRSIRARSNWPMQDPWPVVNAGIPAIRH